MAFQVDQCKHFKDGKKCSKCGRMMPAYCKDQQEIEEKARLYDEWVASQQTEGTISEEEAPASVEETSLDMGVAEVSLGDKGSEPEDEAKADLFASKQEIIEEIKKTRQGSPGRPKGYAKGRRK